MTTPASPAFPVLIQGGMGVAISSWRLASAVGRRGHLGVVSGTAIDRVFAGRLQQGDEGGHLRRACDAFPDQALVDRVWQRCEQHEAIPMFNQAPPRALLELGVLAAFTEIWLAKEGHSGPIGINLLEKIQAPTLPTLYGALLAGVDYVLMGAGIPRDTPRHLTALCQHQTTELNLRLEDGSIEPVPFDPGVVDHDLGTLPRPRFLAIITSHVLAMSLARVDGVDGFVVEAPSAGGHNAPPRGWKIEDGDPVYGPRDVADLGRLARLGKPFWLAGDHDSADALAAAQAKGAIGIQVGTAFAFCSDSGMDPEVRRRALQGSIDGTTSTQTEGRGSPTGFPFKVLDLDGTEGGRDADERVRQHCRMGYLRSPFRLENGKVGWRCAAEPVDAYVAKGGSAEECAGRRCLCNGLLATAGFPQELAEGGCEWPLITAGELRDLGRFITTGDDYDANAVIDYLAVPDNARFSLTTT